jgi:hypothetical protein
VKYSAFALILLLGGCAHLPWQVLPTDIGVEQLCERHSYITALQVLEARKKTTPDYEEKRNAVLKQAQQYQNDLLNQAGILIQQQQFTNAQNLIAKARPELPPSPELDQFDKSFNAARDRYIQRELDELIQTRGPALVKEHAAYQALSKAASDPELQRLLARHQADVDYFAPLIAKAGSQALAQNDCAKAAQYLAIANQLTPSPTIARQLKTAEQTIAAGKQKQQIARNNEREQRYRDLNNALQQSLQQRDFLAARDLLEQAKGLNTHSDELDATQRELDDAIAAFVAQQVDAGNREYAEGRIEEALNNWHQADALTSTPELTEKIDKAQKFIDRLQQLQKPNQ